MRFGTAASLAFATLSLVACSNPGERCVPGLVVECPCAGTTGTQTCQADGTFTSCDCGRDAGGVDGGVPADAPLLADAGSDGGASDAGAPDAPERIYYAGKVDGAGPVWASLPGAAGLTGTDAGDSACASIGGDHVCDYEEVVAAAALGQLSGVSAGTTAWVERTTTALVGGVPSAPGAGGNCHNWTYSTNHTGDGEYVVFEAAGVPTFHLDNDTFYDGIDTTHQIPGDLQCGGEIRSILCCFPAP